MELQDQEFVYPDDFLDTMEEAEEILPPLRSKASTVIYLASAAALFLAVMLPLVDTASRAAKAPADQAFAESAEWNGFTQMGTFLGVQSVLLFLLGRAVDKRELKA